MGRVDDTAGGIPGVLLPGSFLPSLTITDVSTRSRCAASLWTYVAGRHVRFAMRGVRLVGFLGQRRRPLTRYHT